MELILWLKQNKMKQKTLAKMLEVSLPTMARIVSKTRSPSLKHAIKILQITHGEVRIEDLLSVRDEMEISSFVGTKRRVLCM